MFSETSRGCVSAAENHSGRISSVLIDAHQTKSSARGKREEGDKLNQSPTVSICAINLNLKRPLRPSLADKKEGSTVVEWSFNTALFLLCGENPVRRLNSTWSATIQTFSSRTAACAGSSPASTLPPKPLYLRLLNESPTR